MTPNTPQHHLAEIARMTALHASVLASVVNQATALQLHHAPTPRLNDHLSAYLSHISAATAALENIQAAATVYASSIPPTNTNGPPR